LYLLLPVVLSNHLAASYVQTSADQHRWSIGNDLIERTISFSGKTGLRTEALLYKATGHDFTSYSRNRFADEFGFQSNSQSFNGARSFDFNTAETQEIPGGKQLLIQLTSQDHNLAVSVFYTVYDGHAAIRKWIRITNLGSAPVYLKNFHFEALAAAPGKPAELQVSAGYGTVPQPLFFTGRVSDPCITIRNALTGEGIAVINEAPGYLKRTEVGSNWSELFQVMYDTDLFPFGRTLQPQETFESARSSLVLFHDDHGFADSRWSVPGYVAHVISRRRGTRPTPWLYNTWEPFQRRIDQSTVTELASAAKSMGIDIFTIDDGWQTEYGANAVDAAHFPGGMREIRSTLDRNGLALGLWVPLATISMATQDYIKHPEWACRDEHGAPKSTTTASGKQAVMCLGSGYREAALQRLRQLIADYHPGYIKVDLTTVFNTYGEAPGCYASNHDHRDWAESLTRIYEGLEYIGQQLYREHPEVLVDYTFELWGEKHLIDPALLASADLDWLSNIQDKDQDAGGPLQARTLLYQRALSVPSETMLIGNLHAQTAPIEERFAAAIGSGPLFLGDLRKLSDPDRQWYRKEVQWFKNLRRRASLLDSFFPLGNWRQPGAKTWDGFARLSRDSDGIIVLFKNQSSAASAQIQIPAPPGATYAAHSVISGASLGQITATELAQSFSVPFPAGHSVEIIELIRK
jgi:alpha-galactosidase